MADQKATKPVHLQVGEALAKVGVQPTKDAYGQGPEEHGSAWKAPKQNFRALNELLWKLGYRQKKKGIFVRGAVQIDLGQDANTVYLYITDDNGPGFKQPGQPPAKKEFARRPARVDRYKDGMRTAMIRAVAIDAYNRGNGQKLSTMLRIANEKIARYKDGKTTKDYLRNIYYQNIANELKDLISKLSRI